MALVDRVGPDFKDKSIVRVDSRGREAEVILQIAIFAEGDENRDLVFLLKREIACDGLGDKFIDGEGDV